jgi:hypothetical protein
MTGVLQWAASAPPAQGAALASISGCMSPNPPAGFYSKLSGATGPAGVPASWATGTYGKDMARIACYESTYRVHAYNGTCCWGMYQFAKSSLPISWTCYWDGCNGHTIMFEQDVAGLKYAHSRYGNPSNAWAHEVNYGWW